MTRERNRLRHAIMTCLRLVRRNSRFRRCFLFRLVTRGRTPQFTDSHLYHDAQRTAIPAPVRFIPGIVSVSDFLDLTKDDTT